VTAIHHCGLPREELQGWSKGAVRGKFRPFSPHIGGPDLAEPSRLPDKIFNPFFKKAPYFQNH
jgi:hypothetical protein